MRQQLCAMIALFGLGLGSVHAADVIVYDDASQNGFNDGCSFGGVAGDFDFAQTAIVHGGSDAIRFTPDTFNAVSWCAPAAYSTVTDFAGISFWVYLNSSTAGQNIDLILESGGAPVATASLQTLHGSAIAPNQWVQVQTQFTAAPMSYSGPFDKISLQDETGAVQPSVYFDDVTLLGTANPADRIFTNGFEAASTVGTIGIEQNVNACGGLTAERYTWTDASGWTRSATLTHNDAGNAGHLGELCDFTYHTDVAAVRDVQELTAGGAGGFGYVVSHLVYQSAAYNAAIANDGDDSPLGHAFGGSFTRLLNGRHHAILRFQLNYPRWGVPASGTPTRYNMPVTIDWLIATGRDHPLWSATFDLSAAPNNAVKADSRAPYGDMAFDGAGSAAGYGTDVSGVAWGDHYKFTTLGAGPVTLDSPWSWNQPNTVPYVYLWTNSPDAEMGVVQTEDIAKQDAGSEFSSIDWNTTSAALGQGCPTTNNVMPCVDYEWAYQANADDIAFGAGDKHLTWGTGYGFLGTTGYNTDGSLTAAGVGWPKQSYGTWITFGAHSAGTTSGQVTAVENTMASTFSASVGTVVTSGPAGVNRSDTRPFQPAGYNRVYGTWDVTASGGNATVTLNAAGTGLDNPMFLVHNHANALPAAVTLDGAALVADADYFATVDPANGDHADTRVWITVNRHWTGSHTLAVQ